MVLFSFLGMQLSCNSFCGDGHFVIPRKSSADYQHCTWVDCRSHPSVLRTATTHEPKSSLRVARHCHPVTQILVLFMDYSSLKRKRGVSNALQTESHKICIMYEILIANRNSWKRIVSSGYSPLVITIGLVTNPGHNCHNSSPRAPKEYLIITLPIKYLYITKDIYNF